MAGNSRVGKTSITQKFSSNIECDPNIFLPTLGAQYEKK
jgi:hypothetical protein